MKSLYLPFATSLFLAILVGCGGGRNIGNGPSPPLTSFAESWHFDVSRSSFTIDAALTLSSNSVVGVAHFQSYSASLPCPGFFDNLPLSGTIDGQGNVSIKSSAVMGVVLTLNGGLASDHASLSNGNYHFAGGCMDGQAGPLTGVKVKPLTGLYTGTMQRSGNTFNISAQLTQAVKSDEDGLFTLSGAITVSNSCDETFTLAGASVVGGVVHVYSSTGTGLDGLTGVVDSEAQQIEMDDYPYSDDCIAGAHGVVTRHSVSVTAETLFEAVAKALAIFRSESWVGDIGRGLTSLRITVKHPTVTHEVQMQDFEKWLDRPGGSPAEIITRNKLRALLKS